LLQFFPRFEASGPLQSGAFLAADVSTSPPRTFASDDSASVQNLHRLSLDQILESAPDAMLIIGTTGEIVYLNTLASSLFGYARNELLGRSIECLVPPEVRAEHSTHRREFFQSPRARLMETGLELYGLRKDGSRFPVEISLSPLQTPAGTLVLGAIRDRTKKENYEAEIRVLNLDLKARLQELHTANRELQDFTYTTAHDLRAPVRHMQSFAELVRHSAASRLETAEIEKLDRISAAASRLGILIDALLEFSRIGRMTMDRQPVDLVSLIDSVRESLKNDLAGRSVEWKIGPLPVVLADAGMLRVVFTNLLANAVKFTRSRNPAAIEIGSVPEKGSATIFVRDNGVGFDNEYSSKLFQVFQRLHRNDEFEGTGIGLASVRRLIERHGGKVSAEGLPDGGATFFISIPEGTPPHV
jgi:PAS domain S-box-containing protein